MDNVNNFDAIKIGLASPEKIREWSRGAVTKPETINYITLKPEKNGLFCEVIFGPQKDWECYCGKFKRVRYKGIVCDSCGVEVTKSKVRRERMGHIELAAPVSHIWYFKGIPSKMGILLGVSPRDLEKVLYFSSYMVISVDGDDVPLQPLQLLDEQEYHDYASRYGNKFEAGMGAETIKKILQNIDLEAMSVELREVIENSTGQKKQKAIRQLDVVESFISSENKPEWMILDVVPVIPPDLRPMVQLDGGRFAASDLNDLYRRVINRNKRLEKLKALKAPEIICRNEKRMLQEAVDSLIDNGRRGRSVKGPGNRDLKSLSDMLKGKHGRFRQNLLGKRVDYSGRSVIVVGPELKFYQCGLPKKMALELFKPFVIHRLEKLGHAATNRSAKAMVDRMEPVVWDVVEQVIKEHPVLLNRAPTLHRLGIQAFEPVLIEGKAIRLHPLVCTAYNADFDGDQMAVHVPLSVEAQAEARFLMLSINNILTPKDGSPITKPSQDMVLGSYYLTMFDDDFIQKDEDNIQVFESYDEMMHAYSTHKVKIHELVMQRVKLEDGRQGLAKGTVGRFIFNEKIPQDLGFVDRDKEPFALEVDFECTKKKLEDIISNCYLKHGNTKTAYLLDHIKEMGFHYSTKAAISIGVSDMVVPKEKEPLIAAARVEVDKIEKAARRGLISKEGRHNGLVSIWKKTTEDVSDALMNCLGKKNNVNIMAYSGARGSQKQIQQLSGMRGLMANTHGGTVEIPITSNFREGLSVLEYFISTTGARKGNADTALRTADSGYLTRRLVDVSQDMIVREYDCGTDKTIEIMKYRDTDPVYLTTDDNKFLLNPDNLYYSESVAHPKTGEVLVEEDDKVTQENAAKVKDAGVNAVYLYKELTIIEPFLDRINGRHVGENIVDPNTGEVLAYKNQLVDEKLGKKIVEAGIKKARVRSVLTCEAKLGVCARCYGVNLANMRPVDVGEAVGTIAAQSIGEPGTQLTMRTFHTGGIAGGDITQGLPRVEELFEARNPKGVAIIAEIDGVVSIRKTNKKEELVITGPTGEEVATQIVFGSSLTVNEGSRVKAGQILTRGSVNPHDILRIVGVEGVQNYITMEIQRVYRLQGEHISDKHIEIIIKQMLSKVKIVDAGDTQFVPGSIVDISLVNVANKALIEEGKQPATIEYQLLGITKASLATESFLSAASFQETTRVLTEAAIKGKEDRLVGLKENVIIGKLIPAGTGMKTYADVDIKKVRQNSIDYSDVIGGDDYAEDYDEFEDKQLPDEDVLEYAEQLETQEIDDADKYED